MSGRLTSDCYGKHQVRVSKVIRPRKSAPNQEEHLFLEASVNVELTGDFQKSFTDGDNSSVVATDTCKNTVYVVAKDTDFTTIEELAVAIAEHFINQYSHVDHCQIAITEQVWSRLQDCPHAFTARDRATPFTEVTLQRGGSCQVSSGVKHLLIAKTTESGFVDFHRDEYRTLADTDDRILATELAAKWDYSSLPSEYSVARETILEALMKKFIDHYSRSVQETLYFMGQGAIDACEAISDITLTMPNKHHLLFNLAPFNRENENEIFVATDEPFGYINGTVSR